MQLLSEDLCFWACRSCVNLEVRGFKANASDCSSGYCLTCDGVIGVYDTVGSIRLLACSSPTLKVWVPHGMWQQGAKEE